jgi:hypothetical protein
MGVEGLVNSNDARKESKPSQIVSLIEPLKP